MTGQVVFLRSTGEQTVSKVQLAQKWGVSPRSIENYARMGMPVGGLDRMGRRKYSLRECEEWRESGQREKPRDRLSLLEERIERLERRLAG